jgi:hypothetical protein
MSYMWDRTETNFHDTRAIKNGQAEFKVDKKLEEKLALGMLQFHL